MWLSFRIIELKFIRRPCVQEDQSRRNETRDSPGGHKDTKIWENAEDVTAQRVMEDSFEGVVPHSAGAGTLCGGHLGINYVGQATASGHGQLAAYIIQTGGALKAGGKKAARAASQMHCRRQELNKNPKNPLNARRFQRTPTEMQSRSKWHACTVDWEQFSHVFLRPCCVVAMVVRDPVSCKGMHLSYPIECLCELVKQTRSETDKTMM
jgi:hypothetical protein